VKQCIKAVKRSRDYLRKSKDQKKRDKKLKEKEIQERKEMEIKLNCDAVQAWKDQRKWEREQRKKPKKPMHGDVCR
jgi:hypothetical protein